MLEDVLVNFNLRAHVALRRHHVRDARGCRPGDRRGQLLRLPRPGAPPDHAAVGAQAGPAAGDRRRRLRAAPVLLRRAVRIRPHRRSPELRRRRSTATAGTSAAGWSRATGSTSCSSTSTRRTPPSIGRATCWRGGAGRRGHRADGRGGRRLDGVPRPVRRAIVADHSQSAVHEVADLSADTDLRLFRSSRRDRPRRQCDLALTGQQPRGDGVHDARRGADRLRGGAPPGPPPGRRRDDVARGRLARGPPGGRRAAVPAAAATTRTNGAADGRWRATATCSIPPSTRTPWSGSTARWAAGAPATSSCRRAWGGVRRRRRGRHAGGGSHGSLRAEDSLVPLITAGLRATIRGSRPWLRSPT